MRLVTAKHSRDFLRDTSVNQKFRKFKGFRLQGSIFLIRQHSPVTRAMLPFPVSLLLSVLSVGQSVNGFRLPSVFSGVCTTIFLINSLTIAGVNPVIPTYLRIMPAELSKSLLFCSWVSTSCCSAFTFSVSSFCSASYSADSFKNRSFSCPFLLHQTAVTVSVP